MKEAIIVDLNGHYVEPELVSPDTYGVSEIYESSTPVEEGLESEQVLVGYRVAVPVPSGLYRPRWDIPAWQAALTAFDVALNAYNDALDAYDPEGGVPKPQPPEPINLAAFWTEGLTQAEIEAIHNVPRPPTQEERIAQLELDNLNLMLALTEVYEQMIGGSN